MSLNDKLFTVKDSDPRDAIVSGQPRIQTRSALRDFKKSSKDTWLEIIITSSFLHVYAPSLQCPKAPTTHPDVVVRVRRAVVQVGVENAGVRAIVPVAPPKDGTTRIGAKE